MEVAQVPDEADESGESVRTDGDLQARAQRWRREVSAKASLLHGP